VDETALSFAEIKALCAGDPRIKERMELDVDVTRLRLLKSDFQNKRFRMEDSLLKNLPESICASKAHLKALQADIDLAAQHPHPKDGFIGMTIGDYHYSDRESAGEAILSLLEDVAASDPTTVGTYRGFTLSLAFSGFHHEAILSGSAAYRVELGDDARGNVTRIDNLLGKLPQRLQDTQDEIDNLLHQSQSIKEELAKPFALEEELRQKSARLAELDAELKIGGNTEETPAA
jgi:hypothetical protein